MTEDLAAIIERKCRELLDDATEPECPECGRKSMTPTQTIQALGVALKYLASKNQHATNGVEPGSGFQEGEDE
jgi:hypothetical protein